MTIASPSRATAYQFVRFFFVGLSNTAIDFCVYILLTRLIPFFGDHIFIANTIAFIAAATWSYIANRVWTFKVDTKAHIREAVKFYISTTTAFFLSMLTLYVVVSLLHGYDLLGKVAASFISMVWNFTLNKVWVFNK